MTTGRQIVVMKRVRAAAERDPRNLENRWKRPSQKEIHVKHLLESYPEERSVLEQERTDKRCIKMNILKTDNHYAYPSFRVC
jgi:hypothetical protein